MKVQKIRHRWYTAVRPQQWRAPAIPSPTGARGESSHHLHEPRGVVFWRGLPVRMWPLVKAYSQQAATQQGGSQGNKFPDLTVLQASGISVCNSYWFNPTGSWRTKELVHIVHTGLPSGAPDRVEKRKQWVWRSPWKMFSYCTMWFAPDFFVPSATVTLASWIYLDTPSTVKL